MKKFLPILLVVLSACIPENPHPNCDIVSPMDGAEYSRGENIPVYVDASDDNGTVDEVRFYLDSLGISSIGGFPYSFELSTSNMRVGTHSLKAKAIDNSGQETDATVSFRVTSQLPLVETAQPTSISIDSAVVGGTILDNGGGEITAAGVIWGDKPYEGSGFTEVTAEVIDGSFSVTLNDLDFDTYYVLAFAENETGRSYGEQVSFTTLPPENTPPLCEIIKPYEDSEFVLGANIEIIAEVSDEEADIQEVRFHIDGIIVASRANIPYSYTFSSEGMTIGTHSIRVEAIDDFGELSRDSISFVLKPQLPVIETTQPNAITSESAIVGGNITDNGGGTIITAGVLWGNRIDGSDYQEVTAEVINNPYSITLTDLEYETYYVVAFAENESGRSYGEQISFTTLLPTSMFIDNRDGNAYKWVRIGNQIWMEENLAYLPEMGNPSNYSSVDPYYYVYDYMNFKPEEAVVTDNYKSYGVLYNYPAALEGCPDGWHLPTREEEQELISFVGVANRAGKLMEIGTDHWNNNPNGTNSSGFTARGAGWTTLDNGDIFGFADINDATGWWKVDSCATDTTMGMPFTIDAVSTPDFKDSDCYPYANGYSVRCIKD